MFFFTDVCWLGEELVKLDICKDEREDLMIDPQFEEGVEIICTFLFCKLIMYVIKSGRYQFSGFGSIPLQRSFSVCFLFGFSRMLFHINCRIWNHVFFDHAVYLLFNFLTLKLFQIWLRWRWVEMFLKK